MRTVTIQGHSPFEIGRYRTLKLLLGAAMIPLAYHGFAQGTRRKAPSLTPLPAQSLITHDEAMRSDFSLRWADPKKGRLRQLGANTVLGVGPARTDTFLYDGDLVVASGRTGADGRWRLPLRILQPGLHAYHVEFRRNGIGMGQTRRLSATVFDTKPSKGSDVSITNLRPLDMVSAGRFTLRGSAPAGDFVQIYIDATLLGRAEVDLAGRWSFRPKIQGGGRRTFTIVDEITSRQFGPFPLRISAKRAAQAVKLKPARPKSAATVPLPRVAPDATPPRRSASAIKAKPGAAALPRVVVRKPVAVRRAKPVRKPVPKPLRPPRPAGTKPVARPLASPATRPNARPATKPRRTTALGVYAPLN